MTREKKGISAETLYKIFIYVVLITLAILIIVPVGWVFLASIKQNSEFYGNPWALPAAVYWQNFVNAWNSANMGSYMLNSVIVTALSLVLLLVIALQYLGEPLFERLLYGGAVHQRELYRCAYFPDASGRRCLAEESDRKRFAAE